MKFQTQYTTDRAWSLLFATDNTEESLTQQSDKDECDINVIMAKYGTTGQVPQVLEQGIYGDFTEITDYRSALDMVRRADAAFHEVPAEIRKRFDNDPAKFVEFVQNPDNIEELEKLGLAIPRTKSQTAPASTPPQEPPNGTAPANQQPPPVKPAQGAA